MVMEGFRHHVGMGVSFHGQPALFRRSWPVDAAQSRCRTLVCFGKLHASSTRTAPSSPSVEIAVDPFRVAETVSIKFSAAQPGLAKALAFQGARYRCYRHFGCSCDC